MSEREARRGLPFCASVSSKETPLKAQRRAERKARGETAFPWQPHRLSFHAFVSKATGECSHLLRGAMYVRTCVHRKSCSHVKHMDTKSGGLAKQNVIQMQRLVQPEGSTRMLPGIFNKVLHVHCTLHSLFYR